MENQEPNTSANYKCYWCEEEINFSLADESFLKLLFDKGANSKPQWRHVSDGRVACNTVATPSNIQVPK